MILVRWTLPALLFAAVSAVHAQETDRLTILTPHNTQIQSEFEEAFERELGKPVEIRWIKQGTGELIQLLAARDKANPGGGFDADVFFGGGVADHELAALRGYLQKPEIDKAIIEAIPATLAGSLNRDPEGLWIGNALSVFGILVNSDVIAARKLPEVKSWDDLGKPEYHGWVVLCDPRKSASVQVAYEAVLQHYGWTKGWAVLTMMAGNAQAFTSSSSAIPNEIATGNAAAGPAIDFYAYARIDQAGGKGLGYILPHKATAITADPISVLRNPPNRAMALRFVSFVLSPNGQRLWAATPGTEMGPKRYALYRAPILPSVYDPNAPFAYGKNPYVEAEAGNLLALNSEVQGQRATLVGEVIGATLVDLHEELRRTWGAVIKAGQPAKAVEILTMEPFPDSQMYELAKQIESGDRAQRQLVRQWRAEFLERLEQAAAALP